MVGVEYQTHFGVLTSSSSSSTNPQVSTTSVSATSGVAVWCMYTQDIFSEMENIFGGCACNAAVYEPQVGGVGEGQADR